MHEESESELASCVLLEHLLDGDEVLKGFGHFATGDSEVTRVEEVPNPNIVVIVSLGGRKK